MPDHQSLLSLEPKPDQNGQLRLRRRKYAEPIDADAVFVDETSMVPAELDEHIARHLYHAFVLHIGDDHQIPPVGEVRSPTFGIRSKSVLREPVRQSKDNPVLVIADEVRRLQERPDMDWSWVRSLKNGKKGVFRVNQDLDQWLEKAYKSSDFAADSKAFRYVCWTNRKVADINARVRYMLFGQTDTPFLPGETALIRQQIVRNKVMIFATNEEAKIEEITDGTYTHWFPARQDVDEWSVTVPCWDVGAQERRHQAYRSHGSG